MNKLLIIESDEAARLDLAEHLAQQGFSLDHFPKLPLSPAGLSDYAVIVVDLGLRGAPDSHLINLFRRIPVIITSRYANLRSAVDSVKMGAADYLAKPLDMDELFRSIKRALTESPAALPAAKVSTASTCMLGNCPEMTELFRRIQKVAPTTCNVLIEGESGTGKELVARSIHNDSERSSREMISVNCAAIPETLIESELFGHEKGSFTGAIQSRIGLIEAADGSTLFLDEVGELPIDAQARLLRVLQEGEIRKVGSTGIRRVDVRLITATHRNLKELAAANLFRDDLYYRLNVLQLSVPPLRDRNGDLKLLADNILSRTSHRFNRKSLSFAPDARSAMHAYPWPGNIRELENAIERAVVFCEGDIITADSLAISLPETKSNINQDHLSLDDYFQHFVLENEDQMSETELAEHLGISRKSLWERRQRQRIPRQKRRSRNQRPH